MPSSRAYELAQGLLYGASNLKKASGQEAADAVAAGTAYPVIEHTVLGRGRFTLAATVGDEVITNDSAQPLNEWVGAGATGKLLGGW
jgi:hypothetical protein